MVKNVRGLVVNWFLQAGTNSGKQKVDSVIWVGVVKNDHGLLIHKTIKCADVNNEYLNYTEFLNGDCFPSLWLLNAGGSLHLHFLFDNALTCWSLQFQWRGGVLGWLGNWNSLLQVNWFSAIQLLTNFGTMLHINIS